MFWDQLTSTRLSELDRRIPVLLNIAATEQHGSHLPVATDRLIGEHFSTLLNQQLAAKVLILPALAIGCSDHHMEFSGTLTLSHSTFAAVVKEVISAVHHHGFFKVILLNSHGGNQGIMQVIVEELGYANPGLHIVGATWWNLAKGELQGITETGPGGTGHACEFETSLIEVIAPQLIDRSQIKKGANEATFQWAEGDMLYGAKASYYRSMKTMTPNGVYGDPTFASAEKGILIQERVVAALSQLVLDLYSIEG